MLFFDLGIDVVHDFAETGSIINGMLGLMEDGGEMITLSLIGWYTWTFIKLDPYFEQNSAGDKKQKVKTIAPKDRLPLAAPTQKQKVAHRKRSA